MHEFQGKISMELTSFFHNMQESEWTAVFHGSTLSKMNNSLMLTGESGNGKSSLSTILMANNFSLIADDFSPNRLEAVKRTASEFIAGRQNDRIGILVFAGQSFIQCPLTMDRGILKSLIKESSIITPI